MTDKQRRRWSIERVLVVGAITAGLAAGTYGIASAANSSSSSQSTASSLGLPSIDAAARSSRNDQHPWGRQRSDETLLTGEAEAKVRQLALARVAGGTIVRVETDADGNAAYEAHMVKADGTPVTVYVDKQFRVVSVQTGMPARGSAPGSLSNASGTGA
jgi:hypothetical protein